MNNDAAPLRRIGELGRRVGVRPETLRAWERRYGLIEPQRTQSGYRLYSEADEAQVRAMLAWLARGVSAGEAARLARAQAAVGADDDEAGPVLADAVVSLIAALERFDEDGAHRVLDAALARFSLPTVLAELVLPVLDQVGERWLRDRVTVGQEHFCTELLRGRLLAVARGWGGGSGPRALLACPPGERHDLGLICFGLVLRDHGWRVVFLGSDTPAETIADTADRLQPHTVVLAAAEPERLERVGGSLRALAERHVLLVAGGGATAAVARALGIARLDGAPVAAARWMAEQAGGGGEPEPSMGGGERR